MHVAGFAADERLIDFDHAIYFAASLRLQGQPQARQHEPRSFLSDAQSAAEFVTADAVLAVGEQPEGRKPLLKANRGVLEDGTDFERELRLRVLRVALPAALAGEVGYVVGAAGRAADHAVGPADRFDGFPAVLVIREKENRFAEGLGRGCGCHEHIMAEA